MWTLSPWFREHGSARRDYVVDDRAVHVRAIDVQLHETKLLPLDVLAHRYTCFFFGSIRRCHRAGNDRREVEVTGDVFLVAIEALRTTLSTVTHFGVFHRDASVGRHSLSDAFLPILRGLEILA